MSTGVGACSKEEQEHARDGCRTRHGTFTTNVLEVDGVAAKERSRNADDRGDCVVTVGSRDRVGTTAAVVGKVLRQESVEQRVSHTNGSPGEPDEDGGGGKLPAVEKRTDTLSRELASGTLDDIQSTKLVVLSHIRVTADLVQDVLGQPGGSLVGSSNSLNNTNSFSLTTSREQELGRLEEIEEEESEDEHQEGDGAQSQDEITPAPIVGLGADCSISGAREVGDVSPSQKRGDELTNGPPNREEGEKVVGLAGKKLEEQGTVDRKVTTYTESNTGVESTNSNPAVGTTSCETEGTSKEECHVEGVTTADNIRDDTPETSTNAETCEESKGSVAYTVAVDAELSGNGVES